MNSGEPKTQPFHGFYIIRKHMILIFFFFLRNKKALDMSQLRWNLPILKTKYRSQNSKSYLAAIFLSLRMNKRERERERDPAEDVQVGLSGAGFAKLFYYMQK